MTMNLSFIVIHPVLLTYGAYCPKINLFYNQSQLFTYIGLRNGDFEPAVFIAPIVTFRSVNRY